MKKILLLVFLVALLTSWGNNYFRTYYVKQSYDSTRGLKGTHFFIRQSVPGKVTTDTLYAIRVNDAFMIWQDTLYMPGYIGKNAGADSDSMLTISRGAVRSMAKNKFTLPFSQATGTAAVSQLPTIPYSKISGGPVIAGRLPTEITRAFNTAFTPSGTADALVSYTVTIQMPLTLLGLVYGQVFLDISANGSTWKPVGILSNGNGAIVGSGAISGQLSFLVPAGYQARIRTVSQGSVTFTYNNGFETLLN